MSVTIDLATFDGVAMHSPSVLRLPERATPSWRARASAALFLLAVLLPAVAHAQPVDTASNAVVQLAGVAHERPALSTRADARAIAINPAALGLAEMADLDYALSVTESSGLAQGLFGVVPLGGVLGLGAAIEWLRPPDQTRGTRHYRLGAGLALGRKVGLGIGYDFFGSESDLDIDTFDSVTAGLTLRLDPALLASLVIEHLNTPRFRGQWLDPILHVGLGTVLADGRVSLDAAYVDGLPADAYRVDVSASLEPIDGLALFADSLVADKQMRWGGGAELGFGGLAFSAGVYAQSAFTGAGGTAFDGVTAAVSWRSPRVTSLFAPDERWVTLAVPTSLVERAPRSLGGRDRLSFTDLLLLVEAIAADGSVAGVVLEIDGVKGSYAQVYELRQQIGAAQARGKRFVAHLNDTSTRSLYLASQADRVYVSPGQAIYATGLALSFMYYRRVLDMLGVYPEFVKIDQYKTAPDAYLRDAPAAAHHEQVDAYLDGVFAELVGDIARARGLTEAEVRAAFDIMPLRPEEAVAAGLIDGVAFRDELAERLRADLSLASAVRLEPDYAPPMRREEIWSEHHRIAVIYVDGPIVKGPSVDVPFLGAQATGAQTINELLDWAAKSPSVEGIVVRVDSPGGSAHASELIAEAVERAAARKPLVISMGSVAASGGYYIAAPAARIFASPMTLTGSIGVFAGKFDFSPLLAKLGVGSITHKRGMFADIFSASDGWSPEARAQMEDQIQYLYDVFIDRVVRGRALERAHVRSVAQGRVWVGRDALAEGLVDELGGLVEAVAYVRDKAGLASDARVTLLQLPRRSALSALDLGLPGNVVGAEASGQPGMESDVRSLLELLGDASEAPPESHLAAQPMGLEVLVHALTGTLPTAAFYAPGTPLMLLPFDVLEL